MSDTKKSPAEAPSVRQAFRDWFVSPPRAHGEVIEDRTVSFLELFYDLTYVVLIAQVAHTLADDVSWVGVRDFVIVFSLIYAAWVNGSFYHELHGREDGRSRTYIFAQMFLLVLLSVYAGHATAEDGRGFAIVYAILLALLAFQWFRLRVEDTPFFAAVVTQYVTGMAVALGLVVISAVVDSTDARLVLWVATVVVLSTVGIRPTLRRDPESMEASRPTESMSERFGLFTIIVLGEVVVGVVDGLTEADRSSRTIITGLLALILGFSFWWSYFDFASRRIPRTDPLVRTLWSTAHFPLTLSIAATGAGMVSLIEHATDSRTPAGTAWLVAGGTAAVAASVAALTWTIDAHEARRKVPGALGVAAVLALVAGALRPSPIVLVLVLIALLGAVWNDAFIRHARAGTSIVDI